MILDALRQLIRERSQRKQQRLEKRKTPEHKNTDARKHQLTRRECASEIRKPKRQAKREREAKELQIAAASSQPSTSYQSKPSLRIYGEAELAEQPLVLPGVGRDGTANQHLALLNRLNGVQKDGSVILASGV